MHCFTSPLVAAVGVGLLPVSQSSWEWPGGHVGARGVHFYPAEGLLRGGGEV